MANLADNHELVCGGRLFTAPEIAVVCEVATSCRGLSRKELANTISELLGWRRTSGSLKEAEGLLLLARLEAQGLLQLPAKQQTDAGGGLIKIRLITARRATTTEMRTYTESQ